MSLSIIPNNNHHLLSSLQSTRLRSGLESLKFKNQSQADNSGLKVNFSSNYNSNLTEYFAGGNLSSLMQGLKADKSIHKIDPLRAHALV